MKTNTTWNRVHYNMLAKEIRELFPTNTEGIAGKVDNAIARRVLAELALSLCKRFKEDNPRFDPIKFLEACSPDNDLYPLAELYEGDQLG